MSLPRGFDADRMMAGAEAYWRVQVLFAKANDPTLETASSEPISKPVAIEMARIMGMPEELMRNFFGLEEE